MSAQDFGDVPNDVDWRNARITDVGVVVTPFERNIRSDSLTGVSDTSYVKLRDEIVWSSEGTDICDYEAVGNAIDKRQGRRNAPTEGPAIQSGNLMSDYMADFNYYVFSFDYPSVGADGKELMLSGMAACPVKESTQEVHNVVVGTHITITSDED